MSDNGKGKKDEQNPDSERMADQVQNITLAALRDMRFDSPPGSAISAPVSSPLHTPVRFERYLFLYKICT